MAGGKATELEAITRFMNSVLETMLSSLRSLFLSPCTPSGTDRRKELLIDAIFELIRCLISLLHGIQESTWRIAMSSGCSTRDLRLVLVVVLSRFFTNLCYEVDSEQNLLAGFIDCLGTKNYLSYKIRLGSYKLAMDIVDLARSLGLSA